MKKKTGLSVVVFLSGMMLTGCGTTQQPFRVLGHQHDLAEMTGRWVGAYYNEETGTNGSIVFSLAGSTDTAYGDVMMVAQGSSIPFRPYFGEIAQKTNFGKPVP